jgi:hypothetical protein
MAIRLQTTMVKRQMKADRPLNLQETRKLLDALRHHAISVKVYKASELSERQLRRLRGEELTWLIKADDNRWVKKRFKASFNSLKDCERTTRDTNAQRKNATGHSDSSAILLMGSSGDQRKVSGFRRHNLVVLKKPRDQSELVIVLIPQG